MMSTRKAIVLIIFGALLFFPSITMFLALRANEIFGMPLIGLWDAVAFLAIWILGLALFLWGLRGYVQARKAG